MALRDPAVASHAALSALPATELTVAAWAQSLVASFEQEVADTSVHLHGPGSIRQIEACRQILDRSGTERAQLAAAILLRLKQLHADGSAGDQRGSRQSWALKWVASDLLRQPLAFSPEDLSGVIAACASYLVLQLNQQWLLAPLLNQVKHVADEQHAQRVLAPAVVQLSKEATECNQVGISLRVTIARLLDRLSGDGERTLGLVASPWRDAVLKHIASSRAPQNARRAIEHAIKAIGKSKPSEGFLKAARSLFAEDVALAASMLDWIDDHTPEAACPDLNDDVIRGLIWMLAAAGDDGIATRIGKYCELCFKKVPYRGARSIKLGNGTIQALTLLGGTHAIAELTRLKSRVRYPLVVRRIGAALSEIAGRLGVSEDELEEMALPTFGLSAEGERRLPIGDGQAILRVAGTRDVRLTWVRPDGKQATSVPKALKDAAPEAIAATRAFKKQIEGTLAGQCSRLERLYLAERRIPFDLWKQRYLEHPLIADLTRRLIWRFETPGQHFAGIAQNGTIEDVEGRPHPIAFSTNPTVSLWHPLHAEANHVLEWRRRLARLGITQPFKQAHREIYLVTDAERQTQVYSNRFAAHVLRQHQFKALCDQRGWTYRLMGPWDSLNTPTRPLPGQRLSVEFWVNGIDEPQPSGVYPLVATDQVRFVGADGNPVPVADVRPLVFSELMRDVDLFIGVTSVGNDPNWADGGPGGRFRGYWSDYAFGNLSETGKTRAAVLATLLPQLSIAPQCALEDRFLVIRGKLHTYRIHLGSANIQMQPNNQYLCIVQNRGKGAVSPSAEPLLLPFEGDHVLSLILSKAFLLADDDKITDPQILQQMKRL